MARTIVKPSPQFPEQFGKEGIEGNASATIAFCGPESYAEQEMRELETTIGLLNIQQDMQKAKKNIRYVLTEYVEQALETASYDKLTDGTFAGNIEQCPGVVSFGKTLIECQSDLRSTLEDWVLLGLKLGHKLPRIGGIDLSGDGDLPPRDAGSRCSRSRKPARA